MIYCIIFANFLGLEPIFYFSIDAIYFFTRIFFIRILRERIYRVKTELDVQVNFLVILLELIVQLHWLIFKVVFVLYPYTLYISFFLIIAQ